VAGLLCSVAFVAYKPYRLARIVGFFDPQYKLVSIFDKNGHIKKYISESITTRDPGYQARPIRIAVGSGGLVGLGPMQGIQKLYYLPEAHTDFIYAVIGEELGFFGCSAVLAGFLIILWRGLQVAWVAARTILALPGSGPHLVLVIQAFSIISVVLDMGPTKGIPLPMIALAAAH